MIMNFEKICMLAGGVLFGTAGIKILSGKDAKVVYTHGTAAVLRGKDCVMKTVATVKENCGDIYASAKDINEQRYEEAAEKRYEEAKAVVEAYDHGNGCDEE